MELFDLKAIKKLIEYKWVLTKEYTYINHRVYIYKWVSENKDFWSMNMMLDYLSGYGLDHHSRALVDELPLMVEHDLPSIT